MVYLCRIVRRRALEWQRRFAACVVGFFLHINERFGVDCDYCGRIAFTTNKLSTLFTPSTRVTRSLARSKWVPELTCPVKRTLSLMVSIRTI